MQHPYKHRQLPYSYKCRIQNQTLVSTKPNAYKCKIQSQTLVSTKPNAYKCKKPKPNTYKYIKFYTTLTNAEILYYFHLVKLNTSTVILDTSAIIFCFLLKPGFYFGNFRFYCKIQHFCCNSQYFSCKPQYLYSNPQYFCHNFKNITVISSAIFRTALPLISSVALHTSLCVIFCVTSCIDTCTVPPISKLWVEPAV